ncbi:sugar glycosyltransferase [Yokenella regensburgei]|uniref:sugar glycosyltransferase n=1 Tax=Yokenella regensburgei TaxID=158877 RepID=UPI003EDA51D7
MKSFFKQLYRYSHARPYRHNETLWPYVKITRSGSGEISTLFYKRQLIPIVSLSSFKNACQGNALLVATGPSVNELNFDKIPMMPAIGVNGAFCLYNHVDFRFYIIVDTGFIDQRADIVRDIIKCKGLVLFLTMHGLVRIIDKFSLLAIKCQLSIVEDASCKIFYPKINRDSLYKEYYQDPDVFFSKNDKRIGYSRNICHGVFDAGTVVYWALQIISYLGYKQVYIAGLDMGRFHLPRFYETDLNKSPTFLPEVIESIIIPAFTHASEVMKNHNMVIRNLSMQSAIDDSIIEKIDYKKFFRNFI